MVIFGTMAPKENTDFWREIVDSLTDAIVVVSRDLEVIAINASAAPRQPLVQSQSLARRHGAEVPRLGP
jgi:hypothetical protein